MNIEISPEELQLIIKCMKVADDEFGPFEDAEFGELLTKLKKYDKPTTNLNQ